MRKSEGRKLGIADRLFVAVWLLELLARSAWRRLEELRAGSARVRWVCPDQLHLTLKFLGETPEEMLSAIEEALARVAAGFRPANIGPPGDVFPPVGSPRVLWLGVTPPYELCELAARVEDALQSLGFPKEKRPFKPRLTLGRAEPGARFDRVVPARYFGVFFRRLPVIVPAPPGGISAEDRIYQRMTLR